MINSTVYGRVDIEEKKEKIMKLVASRVASNASENCDRLLIITTNIDLGGDEAFLCVSVDRLVAHCRSLASQHLKILDLTYSSMMAGKKNKKVSRPR